MGSIIGTGSLRRKSMLQKMRPDIEVIPVRGNLDTRIRKLRQGEGEKPLDGIMVAMAGVNRMGLASQITEIFSVRHIIPAVCQGILAIECKVDRRDLIADLMRLNHQQTHIRATAERAFLKRLGGSCHIPVAAHAIIEGTKVTLIGMVADKEGLNRVEAESEGDASHAASVGTELAEKLLAMGGDKYL